MVKIGLEIHVAINSSETKMFCGCPNKIVEEPNSITCPTCLGLPGSKPRVNKRVINDAIKIGLVLGCKFAKEMFFSRKPYFYNDLSKNFQITQYEVPLASEGSIELNLAGKNKKIKITRVHLEEDPGKTIHIGGTITTAKYTHIDYNRSGVPLCEIVTDPDFETAEQARAFLEWLSRTLEYLEIYDNSREGALRVDANISIENGERVEVKNIGSFKEVERAINYELLRQNSQMRRGLPTKQETRAWESSSKTTKALRTKETEEGYGYIFEPDLTKITIIGEKIKKIKSTLPELAPEKAKRFIKNSIPKETAKSITTDLFLADMFEKTIKNVDKHLTAKWFAGNLLKTLNYNNKSIKESKLKQSQIEKLLKMIETGKITERVAELALRKMVLEPQDPENIVKNKISDKDELEKIAKKIIKNNKKAVNDFNAGEPKALHFLIGQVMKETKARADQEVVRKLMKKLLKK